MLILAIDSSAVTAGCAVYRDGILLAECFENNGLTHSQTLLPMIDRLVDAARISISDVDKIAVSAGPGSFTGIRIGVSTVKGIAFTYDIPCVEVSTLDSIAYGTAGLDGYIAAVMDARRNQVYNAMYRVSGENIERLTDDRAIAIDELSKEIAELDGNVWLCGDGAAMCYSKLNAQLTNLRLAPDDMVYQSGRGTALAAISAYGSADVSHKELKPRYLRLPQAERELNNKHLSNKL